MNKNLLVWLLEDGLSLNDIAAEVQRTPSTVSYWLKRHDLQANGAARFGRRPPVDGQALGRMVVEGKSVPAIAVALDRSPDVIRRALKAHGLRTRGAANRAAAQAAIRSGARTTMLACRHHGSTPHVLEGRGSYRCMRCRGEQVSSHRRRLKRTLIAEAGGCCVLCGYDRCEAALQFHHVDPSTKEFHLSLRGITRNIADLRREAAKCVLLCATCHAEVEVGFVVLTATPRGGLEPPNLD